MGHSHCIPGCGQNLGQNTSLQCRGFGCHLQSCGHHVKIVQPHATQATSLVDLGPDHEGTNPHFFQSISILLHVNSSLIAPQLLCTYLGPVVWTLVSCLCLHPIPPQ